MKKKDKDFTEEKIKLAEETEKHLEVLIKEAKLCVSEIKRTLARYTETGEAIFRINGEIFDLDKFLRAVKKSLDFEIPRVGITDFTEPGKRIISALKEIDILRNYLHSMPGARLPEMPEPIKKLVVAELLATKGIDI